MSYRGSSDTQPQRTQIDYWETTETVVHELEDNGPLPLEFTVAIERPVFKNGDYGYYRVNATIKVGTYYVRLATKPLLTFLGMINVNRTKITRAVDDVRDMNNERSKSTCETKRTRTRSRMVPPDDKRLELLDNTELDKSTTTARRGHTFRPGGRERSFKPSGGGR